MDYDREPETPRTPYTRLEQELICLRRDLDQTRVELAHTARLVTAFIETNRSSLGPLTPKQRTGVFAGLGAAITVGAWSLYEGAQALRELIQLVLQLKSLH